jgi:hypothetical protein
MPTIIASLARATSTNRNEGPNAGAPSPGNQTGMGTSAVEAAVWRRAHQKWEAAGNPAGDGVRFWWEAEREILQRK